MTELYERVRMLRLLPVYAIYLMTFGLAGGSKWISFPEVPAWFAKSFESTILGFHPLSLTGSFYLIALLEIATFVLFVVSLLRGEFMPNRHRPLLFTALTLAAFTFVALAFGLRLSKDYAGAASLFSYFSGTLVAILYVDKVDRLGTQAQKR